MYWRWQYIFYCKNISWIIYWSNLYQIVWNEFIQVGVIWINVNCFVIFVIPSYRIFARNFFNFKITFALSIFENVVASKVFNFTFCCAMSQQDPLGKIRHRADGVKDVTVACTVSIWDYGSNGYLWVHPVLLSIFHPNYLIWTSVLFSKLLWVK